MLANKELIKSQVTEILEEARVAGGCTTRDELLAASGEDVGDLIRRQVFGGSAELMVGYAEAARFLREGEIAVNGSLGADQ